MAWYTDKAKQNIDATTAIRNAGKLGEAIAYVAQGVKGYSDTLYGKKRAKIEDAQKAATNATKKYVADKGYAGRVDSAKISASASDRRNAASLKVAGINFSREKYKSDMAYKKAIDQEMLRNKGRAITAGAQVKAASISAGAKKYTADVSRENNKRTTYTALQTTKMRTGTQREIARQYAKSAAAKAQAKAKKARLNLKDDMSADDVVKVLRKHKRAKVDDFELEM